MSRFCPGCGSAAAADATTCTICGEPLPPTDAVPGTEPETPAQTAAPQQPARSASVQPAAELLEDSPTGTPPPPSSAFRDYLMSGTAALALALVVFIVSSPTEVKGPPVPLNASGAPDGTSAGGSLPPGHPSTVTPAELTPEQKQQMAAAEQEVKQHPENDDAKLKLANMYFDVDRHTDAIPLYRKYLASHPNDLNARTDMAYSIGSTGDIDGAIAELQRVLKANPKHQNASYNMAMMYFAKRDRDSTLYWFRRVAAIDSTSRAGQTAVTILRNVEHPDSAAATPPAR